MKSHRLDRKRAKVSFRHYDKLPGDVAMMYMPQSYHFTPGRSYVIYAIRQLDWMSGGAYEDRAEFARKRVLSEIHGLIRHENENIAAEAIRALGSRNPYLSDDFAAGWLATIGEGANLPGFAEWDLEKNYLGAAVYWKELAAVVDSDAPLQNRALAVRAMGRSKQPEVLADFPGRVDQKLLDDLAADHAPRARIGAARAIGFGRFEKRIPVMERLLRDQDPEVAKAAAASLLSFPVRQTRKMLETNLDHPWYGPLFVNTLARHDPAPYLDRLGAIIRGRLRVQHWWGGKIPWGESWDILFRVRAATA